MTLDVNTLYSVMAQMREAQVRGHLRHPFPHVAELEYTYWYYLHILVSSHLSLELMDGCVQGKVISMDGGGGNEIP